MDKNIYLSHTTNPDNPSDIKAIHEYYVNLISHMPNNVYWLDKNCITQGCNNNVLKFVGLEKLEDFIGITYEEMGRIANWTEEQVQSFKHDDMQVIATGKPKVNVEEPSFYDENGKIVHYLSTRMPLFDNKNEVIGVVGISIDITDLKLAEEHERIALLEAAESKAKTQGVEHQLKGMTMVTATIAHELRTPLAAIKAAAKGFKQLIPDLIDAYKKAVNNQLQVETISEEQIKLLAQVVDSIEKKVDQSNMVIDILLSNIKNRNVEAIRFEACSARECIQKAISQYTFVNPQPVIEVLGHKDFKFYAEEMLILHIFFNLFKNSIYFIQKARKGKIIIWTELGQKGNEIHFKDTAVGISKKHMPKIFDDFFTYGTNKGTGIGLSFCKKTMQAIGGDITCKSVYGEYTEFTLTFPIPAEQTNA